MLCTMAMRALAITAIVLVAVIMVMGAVAPAMAGNHGSVPKDDPPCDALDDPVSSKDGGNADPGKARAAEEICD